MATQAGVANGRGNIGVVRGGTRACTASCCVPAGPRPRRPWSASSSGATPTSPCPTPNLLANLDTEGTSISALARRAGVTRQAASQQVAALEAAGYIERRPSESDARAVIIIQTRLGRALLEDAIDIVEELEAGYAETLGHRRLTDLKGSLASLLDRIDPIGTLGRD